MLKTALSASLIAFAVLAPVASAAVEAPPRAPKVQAEDPTSRLCAEKATLTKPDGGYAVRLTKEQMSLYASLDCQEPEPCPAAGKQAEWDTIVRAISRSGGGGYMPGWLAEVYRPECALEPVTGQPDKT